MKDKIIHFSQVENATISIKCGANIGTGFIVHSEEGVFTILTCYHIIDEHEKTPVEIRINDGNSYEASVKSIDDSLDVAILNVKLTVDRNIIIPLAKIISNNENWQAFGYVTERVDSPGKYNGKVSRLNQDTIWDVDLNCEQYNTIQEFKGLSGAALVIDQSIVGIISHQSAGTIGAISILKIRDFLVNNGINVISQNENDIPESLNSTLSDTIPNSQVIDSIQELISNGESQYYLLYGNPGSGKTTLSAQIKFSNPDFVICDRYFVKVPDDATNLQVRTSPSYFMKWIETVYCRILFNKTPDYVDKPWNEKLVDITNGLTKLSEHYNNLTKIGFFIVDGLDDIPKDKILEFLAVLPTQLPRNIRIIFSCTSKQVFPAEYGTLFDDTNQVYVTPLLQEEAEQYLHKHLKDGKFNLVQIKRLAEKSEGHPLYLRYLKELALSLVDNSSFDTWIEEIPAIGGQIERYYRTIWTRLEQSANELEIVAILSRARIPIEKKILIELQPSHNKTEYLIAIKKIHHLLKGDDKLSVYHSSFSEYVKQNTQAINDDIHTKLGEWCHANNDIYYSVSERLHHLVNGNSESQKQSLISCSQEWIDLCVLFSVDPDNIASDIRYVISKAAELGRASTVIELLLLFQRANFRYNELFKENAVFMAVALLGLGKPEAAIKYVVRNRSLAVSYGDATYLLQRFYEKGAENQAEELLEAINLTCAEIFEGGLNSQSFPVYMQLRFQSLALSMDGVNDTYERFQYLLGIALKMLEKSGNDEDVIFHFKTAHQTNFMGYMIWSTNFDPGSVRKNPIHPPNSEHVGFIIASFIEALHFKNISPIISQTNNLDLWAKEINELIKSVSIDKRFNVDALNFLIQYSNRLDLVEEILRQEFPMPPVLEIRDTNGVEINNASFRKYILYSECNGYLQNEKVIPKLSEFSWSNWESELIRLIDFTWKLSGALNSTYNVNPIEVARYKTFISEFIDMSSPKLIRRIQWNRAYMIPERLFPSIYSKFTQILLQYFPEEIDRFIAAIIDIDLNYQLGLYSEGYIECLFGVAKILAKDGQHHKSVYNVTKRLESHVLDAVENRWDRNEDLLRIVELYSIIGNIDAANESFKKMIQFSMGPSWYKEDQLEIINTTVANVLPNNSQHYISKFAAHLHNASGEMTFQRYVKYSKEKLVGNIAATNLKFAIEYFKYLTLPDFATVINNAESGKFDMPAKGMGYILGAREIEEQSAILEVLLNLDLRNPFASWALTELFIPGDDRYLNKYVDVQLKIINSCEPPILESLLNRLVRFIVCEIDNDFRDDYINSFLIELDIEKRQILQNLLIDAGFSLPNHETKIVNTNSSSGNEEKSQHPLGFLEASYLEARKYLDSHNKTGATKIIVDALGKAQNLKYNVWTSSFYSEIDRLRNLLSEVYVDSSSFMKHVRPLIVNEPYYNGWGTARQLIEILKNLQDDVERETITNVVLEHVDLLVRTPNEIEELYSFLNHKPQSSDDEESLRELLIWFLNHPTLIIKNRCLELLVWVASLDPVNTINSLVSHILTSGNEASQDLAASIFHNLSVKYPEQYWIGIESHLKSTSIYNINHFMVKKSLIDSLNNLNKTQCDNLSEYVQKLLQPFIDAKEIDSEVYLDDKYLEPISDLIFDLNEMRILSKDFVTDFQEELKRIFSLKIEECLKADQYIIRSFDNHHKIPIQPVVDDLLYYALNVTITRFVTVDNIENVTQILRRYQPTFPEQDLDISRKGNLELFNTVQAMIENRTIPRDGLGEGKTIVSLKIRQRDVFEDINNRIEIFGYFLPIDEYEKGNYSFDLRYYSSNQFRDHTLDGFSSVSTVSNAEFGSIGSPLIPSKYVTQLGSLIQGDNHFSTYYFRNGRNWTRNQFGAPYLTGYVLYCNNSEIEKLRSQYKYMWYIKGNTNSYYVDVFENKFIKS